ncbi:MAG: alpha/beta fold hydrolase [Candidatus Hodarchaeales archaeon]|jgi:pimeloyl-ACP methyl ester carboxylesterase
MKYETKVLNDHTRKLISGEFIKLSNGFVHYEIGGSEQNSVVVLVHGFSSPLFVWDHTFNSLIEAGFRVLRYDLYGRGYSDRPKVNYNLKLFDQQLYELIKELNLTNVNLVGLSMGGGIAAIFADRHPELVNNLVLIDPIGMPTDKRIFPLILEIPLINRFVVKLLGHKRILEGQREDFYHYDDKKIEKYLEKFSRQMEYKGFLRAIRSTVLNVPFTGLGEVYQIQLFWGSNDPLIPYSTSKKICNLIPSINFHTIDECGHMPQYSKPEEVNRLLIKFLKNQ